MPPHPSTNFEIQKHYLNEPRFIGIYSRNNLPKIKDGAYVINMSFNKWEVIGWLCIWKVIISCTLAVLELNIFQQKSLETKT